MSTASLAGSLSPYRARTRRRPLSTSCSNWPLMRPARSRRKSRSTVMTWETLATESLGSPVAFAGRRTFPGASTRRALVMRTTAITVRRRLRLKASLCTMTTGRRYPGSEPSDAPRSAHHTSPRSITTSREGSSELAGAGWLRRVGCPLLRRRHLGVPSLYGSGAWRRSRPGPSRKAGSERHRGVSRGSRRNQRVHLEWTTQSSYRGITTV